MSALYSVFKVETFYFIIFLKASFLYSISLDVPKTFYSTVYIKIKSNKDAHTKDPQTEI